MVTYTLQWLLALLTLAFGVLALRIARPQLSRDPFHRSGWQLVGVTLLIEFVCQAFQYAWGGFAMWAGRGSAQMETYLRWSPGLNHSRTFLSLVLSVALLTFALKRTTPGGRFWAVYLCGVALAFAVGTAVGAAEGPQIAIRHYLRVALWDTVELLVVLVTLFVLLFKDRIDRYLWGALATNAFSVALSIIWLAALSRLHDPNSWSPAPWQIATYRVVLSSVMVALAGWRFSLGRRGVPVGGLIGRSAHPAPALQG